LTVNVCPWTVIAPERVLVVLLAAAVNDRDPLPLPVVAPGKLIQEAIVLAVHPQPAGAMTLKDPEPPAAAMGEGTLVGLS
jgi:hypothetical protein